jgi:hypothetical protein
MNSGMMNENGPDFYQTKHFASQRNLNTEGCLRYVNFHKFIAKDSVQHIQFRLLSLFTKLDSHYSATCKDGLNETIPDS